MYNARERITKGMIKEAPELPSGSVTVYSMKAPKDVEPFYVSTAERQAAKRSREDRKKLISERRMKAREDKQTEHDFAYNNIVAEPKKIETKVQEEVDEKDVFTLQEHLDLAQEFVK